jgi:hypothetical protein
MIVTLNKEKSNEFKLFSVIKSAKKLKLKIANRFFSLMKSVAINGRKNGLNFPLKDAKQNSVIIKKRDENLKLNNVIFFVILIILTAKNCENSNFLFSNYTIYH